MVSAAGMTRTAPKLRSWVPVRVPQNTGLRETRLLLETLMVR
jgi:hypothetical protein